MSVRVDSYIDLLADKYKEFFLPSSTISESATDRIYQLIASDKRGRGIT